MLYSLSELCFKIIIYPIIIFSDYESYKTMTIKANKCLIDSANNCFRYAK